MVLAGGSAFMIECLVLGLPRISAEAVASLGFELFLCFHKTYHRREIPGELHYSGNNSIGISYMLNSI